MYDIIYSTLYLEEIINTFLDEIRGITVGGRSYSLGPISFVDNMMLLNADERKFNGMLRYFNRTCEEFGVQINIKKTKMSRTAQIKICLLYTSRCV